MPQGAYTPPSHGGQLRWATQQFGHANWLDFSANLNPLGPPRSVLGAVSQAVAKMAVYPDLEAATATAAVAQYLQVAAENLLLTNGGAEAIHLAVRASGCRRAVVIQPSFGGYTEALRAHQLPWRGVPEEGLTDLLARPLPPRTLVIWAQPNNPTGRLTAVEDLVRLAAHVRAGEGRLLVDEAFVDFVVNPARHSLRTWACTPDGPWVVGSLTKFFTLPGLRLGYFLGPLPDRRRVAGLQPAWSVNALAQVAGEVAVRDEAFIEATRAWLPPARAQLADGLGTLFRVWPSEANFLLLDATQTGRSAQTWAVAAAAHGILLRDASNFRGLGPYHLRVAVRLPEENARLVNTLQRVAADSQRGQSPCGSG